MGNGLHVKVISDKYDQSKFDPSFGSLVLSEARSFQITVKEYEDEMQKKSTKNDEDIKFAQDKWRERSNAGWTNEKLKDNWKANENARTTAQNSIQDKLEKDYKEVNWVWVVAPKQLIAPTLARASRSCQSRKV